MPHCTWIPYDSLSPTAALDQGVDKPNDCQHKANREHRKSDAEPATVEGIVVCTEDLSAVDTSDVGVHDNADVEGS